MAPNQFRTSWAVSSLKRSLCRVADYDAMIDLLCAARLGKDARQPGNPEKAAALLIQVIAAPQPPARVVSGSLALAGQKFKRSMAGNAG